MAKLKIASSQIFISADIDTNIEKILHSIQQAAGSGADLVVFPECAITGYPPVHHSNVDDLDLAAIANANDKVRQAAKDSSIWVVVGSILPSEHGLFNAALLIDDRGKVIGTQSKLHAFGLDSRFFSFGNTLELYDVKGVKTALQICYDVRFPEAFRLLRNQGAELYVVILYASGGEIWKRPVLEGTFRCRAAENTAYLAAVNCAGPKQMCVSRVCDPFGVDLACATADTEQLIFAEIDTENTNKGYYHDRRTDLFSVEILKG